VKSKSISKIQGILMLKQEILAITGQNPASKNGMSYKEGGSLHTTKDIWSTAKKIPHRYGT
jgi:hypothetical protein